MKVIFFLCCNISHQNWLKKACVAGYSSTVCGCIIITSILGCVTVVMGGSLSHLLAICSVSNVFCCVDLLSSRSVNS